MLSPGWPGCPSVNDSPNGMDTGPVIGAGGEDRMLVMMYRVKQTHSHVEASNNECDRPAHFISRAVARAVASSRWVRGRGWRIGNM